jgi:hypothetical protein
MFRRDGGDLVKRSTLAFTIDAILDFAGERRGPFRMIECEIMSYGTPPELFHAFFRTIAETLRELPGAEWWTEIEDVWRKLLDEIDGGRGRKLRRSATRRSAFGPIVGT